MRTQPQLSNNPRQFLQGAPVFEALLLCLEQRLARVAVFVEVFRETAFGAGEADEVIDFAGLRFDEEIRFLGRRRGRFLVIDSAEEPLIPARSVFLLARPRAALI